MGENKQKTTEPLEDRALKLAVQFFGNELFLKLGIQGRVSRIAPTEQVHLEMKNFLGDFNFEMEDVTWNKSTGKDV